MDSRSVYEDALRTWGAEAQTKMLFEEIGELMQAVCKSGRVENWEQRMEVWHNIAEEIADVKSCWGRWKCCLTLRTPWKPAKRKRLPALWSG